jgi:peptidoglycan/xylan/chitin deacetylase (PgdA/CDA1 family)
MSRDHVGRDLGRDYLGYGANPPRVTWPGGALLPVVFVVNLEEGSEPSMQDGDGYSEWLLTEAGTSPVPRGTRDLAAESMFEFGSRVGFWRLMRLFDQRGLRVTVAACARALERNPEIAKYLAGSHHETMCHGLRWINHFDLEPAAEEEIIREAVRVFERTLGKPPAGWMCRYGPSPNTRRLLRKVGGFRYDSDSYADELPYWVDAGDGLHLVIPHTFANNDNKFPKGWLGAADEFERWLSDALDQHLAEASWRSSVLTISVHCRVSGQAARAAALARFLDKVARNDGVWNAVRSDLADVFHAAAAQT